jgi:hypothetical protein
VNMHLPQGQRLHPLESIYAEPMTLGTIHQNLTQTVLSQKPDDVGRRCLEGLQELTNLLKLMLITSLWVGSTWEHHNLCEHASVGRLQEEPLLLHAADNMGRCLERSAKTTDEFAETHPDYIHPFWVDSTWEHPAGIFV